MRKKKVHSYLTCKICNKTFTAVGLAKHVQYVHKFKTGKEYFDTYVEPYEHICSYCHEKQTKYINIVLGYNDSCGSPECELAKIRKTKFERYGDPNYSNRQKFKDTMANRTAEEKQLSVEKQKNTRKENIDKDPDYQKNINRKSKQTRLERYGKFESDESAEKRKRTMLDKYGVENSFQMEKIKQTNLKKYGVEYPFQSKEICEKRAANFKKHCRENPEFKTHFIESNRKTREERYGNPNYRNIEKARQTYINKSDEEKQEIIKKRQKTNLKKYNVKNYTTLCKRTAGISKLSLRVKNILELAGIPFEIEYQIEFNNSERETYRAYDFKFDKIILELNRDYFHANPAIFKPDDIIRIRKEDFLAKDLWEGDLKKRQLAESHGFTVKYLWEREMKKMSDDEILDWIKINCLNNFNI